VLLAAGAASLGALGLTPGTARADHPRIKAAIGGLTDAREYLRAAPNMFGGHKKAAIEAINGAIAELEQCLKF
jgi:hypothetical protein